MLRVDISIFLFMFSKTKSCVIRKLFFIEYSAKTPKKPKKQNNIWFAEPTDRQLLRYARLSVCLSVSEYSLVGYFFFGILFDSRFGVLFDIVFGNGGVGARAAIQLSVSMAIV